MGTYFNPDGRSYRQAVRSSIYVDKTGLLEIMNKRLFTDKKCVALSHARRFGKSQAARMIDAYYSRGADTRELFSQFEIAQAPDFEEHLNKYNVIHLDISSFWDCYKDNIVEKIVEYIFDELRKEYPQLDYSKSIQYVLKEIVDIDQVGFVIIIDEWDCIIRNSGDEKLVHKYLQFLHTLFKSEEAQQFLALGYITGILPIKKIKDESALNNFVEYTMINSKELTRYYGFTEEEVRGLCEKHDMDFDSVKKWYDGYRIAGLDMYNPNSVYDAMTSGELDSYWKNTSAFETINQYIGLNFDGLKDDVIRIIEGEKVPVKTNTFQNDLSIINSRDEALTALIHLGYLAYDSTRQQAYMPNYEVAEAYSLALSVGNWSEIARTISKCDELLWATIDGKCERVAELIDLAHESYTSILKYNDENSLSCAITMAYFTAPAYYDIYRELPSGKGFADMVFIPRRDCLDKPAMIVELKYDKDADTALRQIKEKRYTGALSSWQGEVLLVGVSYDKETKVHECGIEVWE